MKMTLAVAAGAVLTMTFAAGCQREEPKPGVPPTPAATAPEPPNPPTVTGTAPTPAPPPKDAGPAERAGRAIGEQIDDATLTAKVKTALLQAPDVKGTDVNVQTEKGVVQLSGFVATQTEIERAMVLARAVKGVKEVHNKMSLKSGK
jgi:hyperosmotically inducible protein